MKRSEIRIPLCSVREPRITLRSIRATYWHGGQHADATRVPDSHGGARTGPLLPHASERLDAQYAGVLINESYPQMAEVLRRKGHVLGEVFQSDWYRHDGQMFADRL